MRPARQYSASGNLKIEDRIRIRLETNCSVREECFAALNYYAEVDEVGYQLVRKFGHKRYKNIYSLFRSFVRQAQNFYVSAEALPYRSSALLYYYSFLNLAKAYICLRHPTPVKKRIGHGLSRGNIKSSFDKQTVKLGDGVFPLFYHLLTGDSLRLNERLNVVRLLGYCTDIGYENAIAQLSPKNWNSTIPVQSRFAINGLSNKAWPVLMLPFRSNIEAFQSAYQDFFEYFEEVAYDYAGIRALFDLTSFESDHCQIFESRREYDIAQNNIVPIGTIESHVRKSLGKNYLSIPHQQPFSFYLSVPLRKNLQKPFNEVLAIYALMFFLGDLVRYNPSYLEELYESKRAWILERFTSGCSITLLRHMTNLILDVDHVFISR